MPPHLTFWELESIWAFSCLCCAWISSCKGLCHRGSREPAPFWTWGDAHGCLRLGGSTGCQDPANIAHVLWMYCPGVFLPDSAAFQGISRENYREKNSKAVPDDSLPVRFKLQKAGSKIWPDLVLLVQTLQLCSAGQICYLPLPLMSLHHLFCWVCPLWKKILLADTKGRSGSSRTGAAWNGLKLHQGFSGACPAHGIASRDVRTPLITTVPQQLWVSQSFQLKSRETASATSALTDKRD